MLLYLPLVALTVYFAFQYRRLLIEIGKTNLKTIAANQADTLDLFLRERALNLSNLIDNPKLQLPPTSAAMHTMLNTLRSNSEVFVDVGFFDSNGIQVIYAGPLPWLEKRDYSRESWWYALKDKKDNFVITDNYLGFRQKPHLTIAVSRIINNQYVALRAALDSISILPYTTLNPQGVTLMSSIRLVITKSSLPKQEARWFYHPSFRLALPSSMRKRPKSGEAESITDTPGCGCATGR
jgi:two-component system NtrC family sensor kinase